ncbi:TPM domain-containing protein [bacterium]|nr:MAG: TPM domain-containing protein [bacterium]
MERLMNRIAVFAATCAFALAGLAAPALARDSYVQDGAALFSSGTVSALNGEIGSFASATGKEVVVVTVPTLNGTALAAAAESTFAQQSINGVLIFVAKAEHSDYIVGDRAAHRVFPPGEIAHIRDAMNASFRQGDFDGGVTNAVGLVLDTYRSHPAAGARSVTYGAPAATTPYPGSQRGTHVGLLWWILIIVGIFWIVRSVLRSAGGFGRPGYGPGAGPAAGPGYGGGGPGYGYGGWGGGGGFWSGLLGGLGGAWLGNELFGQHNQGTIGTAGTFGDPNAANPDAGAYQPDAGQPDMGNASGGSWGDPGGGWGGGDPGGGWGGGDAGGGGWGGGDGGGGGW